MGKGAGSPIGLIIMLIVFIISSVLYSSYYIWKSERNKNRNRYLDPNPNPDLNLPEEIRYYVSRGGIAEEFINEDLSSENAIGYELYTLDNNDLYHFHSRLPNSIPKDMFDILPDGYDMVYFGVDGVMHTHNRENLNDYEPAGNELFGYNEQLNRYILLR